MKKVSKSEKKIATLKNALAHIKDIAKLLTPEIWIKADYGFVKGGEVGGKFDKGSYCLMGASYRVDGPAEKLAQKYMLKEAKKRVDYVSTITNEARMCGSVEAFNDREETTFEDVQKFLKTVAKTIRADIRLADGK